MAIALEGEIACIGIGVVGCSWAVIFARAGHKVALWDVDSAASSAATERIAAMLSELEKVDPLFSAEQTFVRIRTADSLGDALAQASHVQESVAERLEIKHALFEDMAAMTLPEATLASSTSAIPGSQFMMGRANSPRCLVAHPVNPPHLIPLVELCPTPQTDPAAIDQVEALMCSVGQHPIRLSREIEGFALNRLQWALLSEAMHLIGEGYCSPQDIDSVMTEGLALRWAHLGPLAVGHLNAAKVFAGYSEGLSEAISRVRGSLRTDYVPSPETVAHVHDTLVETMPLADLPVHQAKRDRMILRLRNLLKD